MRLLFVADGRSPTALNWIRYFIEQGHEVHLASTYACQPQLAFASFTFIPVAFSKAKEAAEKSAGRGGFARRLLWSGTAIGLRTAVRQWLGPFTLPEASKTLAALIRAVQPDLVHAMRIPYEGMLAASALRQLGLQKESRLPPLVVSVWGNDFTLHARSTPWLGALTCQTLRAASALHTDCQRDQRLARAWGFPSGKPAIVLPGGGGIQMELFNPPEQEAPTLSVINPRGLRAYVRNDTFFKSIPLILSAQPSARFFCPTMAGEPEALRWVDRLGISASVELLPHQTRPKMAALFRGCQVAVSPSTHDGTPNTLLEAMACGCFPVAGDIESLREWITPSANGLLVDPASPTALAQAVLEAFDHPDLRRQAAVQNRKIIAERADYRRVMPQAENFYIHIPLPPRGSAVQSDRGQG